MKYTLGATCIVVFILAVMMTMGAIGYGELQENVSDLEDNQARIARWYEDGSGRLKVSNGVCIFPAFDSPEDKVICHKEEE